MMNLKTIFLTLLVFGTIVLAIAIQHQDAPLHTEVRKENLSASFFDATAKSMLDSICKTYDDYNSMKVRILLTTAAAQGKMQIDTITGFTEGKKYRLEMRHQDIVNDGKKVWFHDKLTQKIFQRPNNPKEVNFIYPNKAIKSWVNAFNYSIAGELTLGGSTFVKMSFTPKIYPNLDAEEIHLIFDKDSFEILKITFLEPNGYVYVLDYQDLETNLKFDPSVFVLNFS